jgi:Coenzyme PQQ synthesis protein D (PqqD)
MIAPNHVIHRAEELLDCTVGADVVVMSVPAGMYFLLDTTAAYIWTALESPRSFGDLCVDLTEHFDVTAEQCTHDVSAYLELLAGDSLVRIAPPPS